MNPPASEMTWISPQPDGIVLNLRVIPRAPRDAVDGVLGDALKVRLQAPPVEGEANAALVRFLAKRLGLPRSAVRLLAGAASRHKRVHIAGLTSAQAVALLNQG